MGKGPVINGVYYKEFGNFYCTPFIIDGVDFISTEQYYQYKKCEHNKILQDQILMESNPTHIWKLGRSCKDLPLNWEQDKIKIMRKAIEAKFTQNQDLATMLINTYPHDIWFQEKGNMQDFWDFANMEILTTIREDLVVKKIKQIWTL